ncbi:MAG: efflux RND transporter periplasmic adaptor subunit [bacterium]|nr:MAG: efflux RND transporter periplasmic adaptor subunit [bacterium]
MNDTRKTKRGRGRLILWVVVAVVVAVFAVRFWRLSQREIFASIRSVQESEGKPVEVIAAAIGDLELWTTLAGTVEGSFQYPVVSTNSIRVIDVVREEGDRVNAGDVIVRLEKTAPNPMLHSYNRSKALYEDALADARRMRKLYDEGAVSKQALDKAELALKVAKSDLVNARESTNLVASHAGIVTSIDIEEGEMAPAHKPLAWVARTDSVKIVFEAGSRQAIALRVGQKAVWRSNSTGDSGEGTVNRLDLAADPETHLLEGEALFPNPDRKLIPGLLISFRVRTGERRGIVKIPIDCLMQTDDRYTVFVVEPGEDGKDYARLRAIETGLRTSDDVEVLSGIAAGERVVEFGKTRIDDGDLVKIISGGEER